MSRVLAAIVIQALVLACAAQAPGGNSVSPERELLKLLNLERQRAGLSAFRWNEQLAVAAQAHSQKLASHGQLSHRFPGEPELTERISAAGARYNAAAENVAAAGDPEEAHMALMNSPGHRANILNPEYNSVGVAVTWVDQQMYVTEDFARVIPTYSAEQFRGALVDILNRERRSHRLGPIGLHSDAKLDRAACSERTDPSSVLGMLPGATKATVFTASEPSEIPPPVEAAATDNAWKRMSIGVCFRKDPRDKVAKFWVITAFYHSASASGIPVY